MCGNIRALHNFEPAATDEEIRAAALQYVRKISGTSKPSRANEVAQLDQLAGQRLPHQCGEVGARSSGPGRGERELTSPTPIPRHAP